MRSHRLILFIALLIFIAGCTSGDPATGSVSAVDKIYNTDPQRQFIGQEIGDLHLLDLVTDEQVHLDALYQDKIVIIETFSNGCPACVEGIGKYNPIYEQHKDKLELVYLGIEPSDTPEAILATKDENGGGDWIWTAYQGNLIPFYEQYNLRFNDMTMIIDKSGKVAYADSFTVPVDRLMAELAKVGVQ